MVNSCAFCMKEPATVKIEGNVVGFVDCGCVEGECKIYLGEKCLKKLMGKLKILNEEVKKDV